MKKLACIILIMLLTVPASANSNIVYKKSDTPYDYGDTKITVAVNADTNEIIPLSIAPYDGYTYAYMEKPGNIEIKKVEPMKFTDVDDFDLFVEELSARGVLVGNGDGTFLPKKELTRAEMAAIFLRLFDIEKSSDAPAFSDTHTDDWFTPYVTALYNHGVFKKDVLFNPNDIVTREQLIVMTHRMLSDFGYIKDKKEADFTEYVDIDSVSEFAKKPYKDLKSNGYMLIEDWIDNDFEDLSDDQSILKPQNGVTRYECASFLYYIIRDLFVNNAPAIKKDDAPDVDIPVLDGSTSTYAITNNIYYAYYENSQNLDSMPKAHSKTSNSYKRLIDGEVEMIFVPDPSKDITEYAQSKGVKLKFVPIANEALVFFTDKGNKANNITTEQLRKIYVDNSIKNWSEIGGEDKSLVAYCRNNDSGSHAQMEKFILDGKNINSDISLERTSYIMASILTDVENYNMNNTNGLAMGYSLYYYFQTSEMLLGLTDLKLMNIDGIEASDETISNGTYPYTTNYYAVVRDEENERVDKFLELLKSDFGDEIILNSGLGVIKNKNQQK